MRIKASKLLAAVLALCLTLGTAPAASAAALPQSAPGSQDITPYFLYIKGQDCILDSQGGRHTSTPGSVDKPAWPPSARSGRSCRKSRALTPGPLWISGLTSRMEPGPRWTRQRL